MLKNAWIILAAASFGISSILGFFLMPFDGSHHDISCFASVINNSKSPCPEEDPLGFVNFHNNAFQKISNLIISDFISMFFIGVFLALLFSWFILCQKESGRLVAFFLKFFSGKIFPAQIIFLNWFSLHENSPSFS